MTSLCTWFLVTAMWLSCDCHVAVMCLSCICNLSITYLLSIFPVNIMCSLCVCHVCVMSLSCNCHFLGCQGNTTSRQSTNTWVASKSSWTESGHSAGKAWGVRVRVRVRGEGWGDIYCTTHMQRLFLFDGMILNCLWSLSISIWVILQCAGR